MRTPFTLNPSMPLRRRGYGGLGSIFYHGVDGIEVELPRPSDYATVEYQLFLSTITGVPFWAAGGAPDIGWMEPEVSVDESNVPSVDFAINADGEWDIVMVWRDA